MAKCLVTGAAGFIGSHLSQQLMQSGHSVVGVDTFIPYYPRPIKELNLGSIGADPLWSFHQADLRDADINALLEGVDTVFHLAAMPGLPRSWSEFELYMTCNVLATQRLLEAARLNEVKHFIYGSTSSVYGRFATGDESAQLRPISPYGVTKLAGEQLAQAYSENYGLPLTIVRFFSVYGPRQRPDMAYNQFIRALLSDQTIHLYGDGEQSRSNTFVADCVRGIEQVFEQPERSVDQIFNLGGGEIVTMNAVIHTLEEITGKTARIQYGETRAGDQRHTAADTTKAQTLLGYRPLTRMRDGLQAQVEWQKAVLEQRTTDD
jgi:UDP-glucuronate 4-epimerase